MHVRVMRHLLGTLTEVGQFFQLRRICFDVPPNHLMFIAHDEQEDRSIQSLRLIELEFGYRKILRISYRAFRDLAVLVTDDPHIRRTITNHL